VHTIELQNPKILIRPSQDESTKGKDIIIGEERPEKKVLQSKTSRATMQTSMLGLGGGGKARIRRPATRQPI